MEANVLQHQYAVSTAEGNGVQLATKGIVICTAWYGWDQTNKICFLCHFDHPFSAFSTPHIIKNIKKQSPKDHAFETMLIGGKYWFWSPLTRWIIEKYIVAQGKNFTVENGPYDNWPPGKSRSIVISPRKGLVSNGYVDQDIEGRSCKSGFLWTCWPMERVEFE